MNDKTVTSGYSQALGLTGNSTTTTTATWDGLHTIATPGWSIPINGGNGSNLRNGSVHTSISTLAPNTNNMVKQVKAAVLTVTRNEDNKVVSAEFVKEMWVEIKNGSSLDLAVAKELKGDYDPSTTVVRELLAVNFS